MRVDGIRIGKILRKDPSNERKI